MVPTINADDLQKITSFSMAMHSYDTPYTQDLPDFPTESLATIAQIIDNNPDIAVHDAIYQIYPYNQLLSADSRSGIQTLFESLKIPRPDEGKNGWPLTSTLHHVEKQAGNSFAGKVHYRTR